MLAASFSIFTADLDHICTIDSILTMKDISSSLFTEDLTMTVINGERCERISARELHKYVMGLVGVFMLFAISYSIAIYRTTQQEKIVVRSERAAELERSKFP